MKIEGKQIILETGDVFTGEGYTFVVKEKSANPQPTPTSSGDGRLDLWDLLGRFNSVLTSRGYNAVNISMDVFDYLSWAYDFTKRQYESDTWIFRPETYPLLYDYRGKDTTDDGDVPAGLEALAGSFVL